MKISDLSVFEDLNESNNLVANAVTGGSCAYPFRRIYDPEILAAICANDELLKEMFPQPKPQKTTDGSKYKRVYGAQTTDGEIQRLIK